MVEAFFSDRCPPVHSLHALVVFAGLVDPDELVQIGNKIMQLDAKLQASMWTSGRRHARQSFARELHTAGKMEMKGANGDA